jgi:hypothetical protein
METGKYVKQIQAEQRNTIFLDIGKNGSSLTSIEGIATNSAIHGILSEMAVCYSAPIV